MKCKKCKVGAFWKSIYSRDGEFEVLVECGCRRLHYLGGAEEGTNLIKNYYELNKDDLEWFNAVLDKGGV